MPNRIPLAPLLQEFWRTHSPNRRSFPIIEKHPLFPDASRLNIYTRPAFVEELKTELGNTGTYIITFYIFEIENGIHVLPVPGTDQTISVPWLGKDGAGIPKEDMGYRANPDYILEGTLLYKKRTSQSEFPTFSIVGGHFYTPLNKELLGLCENVCKLIQIPSNGFNVDNPFSYPES